MQIKVNRFFSSATSTLSLIFINGVFQCFGLEDEFREIKVAGETRIPAGNYQVGVRAEGGFHSKYLARFGQEFHRGMLHVQEVPGFEFILIHCGNTEKDTAGCLLVGQGVDSAKDAEMVTKSTQAYKEFYSKVIDQALMGKLWITYEDNDRG